MKIVEMNPELAWKAIEGYTNVLAPAAEDLRAFYRQFKCHRCGGAYQQERDARHVFREGTLVPRSMLRCLSCHHLLDPFTGLTIEVGDTVETPTKSSAIRLPHRG